MIFDAFCLLHKDLCEISSTKKETIRNEFCFLLFKLVGFHSTSSEIYNGNISFWKITKFLLYFLNDNEEVTNYLNREHWIMLDAC